MLILAYTTLHYTTLHYTTLHCTALHCTALHYTALHCTALHCTALHCTALHCTTLHYTTIQYIQDMNSYQPLAMKSFPENALKRVGDFKHLGSHIMCLAKDFRKRKDQAWNACNKLEKVWRSNLPNNFKLDLQVSL